VRHQNLAVRWRQSLTGITHALTAFVAEQVMSRCRATVDKVIDQQEGRVIGPSKGMLLESKDMQNAAHTAPRSS
jgi:hypothetical protein